MKTILFFILFTFGCSTIVNAQVRQFYNELKGYEFFGAGKLKPLQLSMSGKSDVGNIFGSSCEKSCDYDADWLIHFEYFEDIWSASRTNEKNQKVDYVLDSKYLGKLRLIEIFPKKSLSFVAVAFPNAFQKLIETSTTDHRSGKSKMTVNDSFNDSLGLSYQLYGYTKYDDFKNTNTKSHITGDLVLIRYELPKPIEHNLFVLKQ